MNFDNEPSNTTPDNYKPTTKTVLKILFMVRYEARYDTVSSEDSLSLALFSTSHGL